MRSVCIIAAGAVLFSCWGARAEVEVVSAVSIVVNDSVITYAEIHDRGLQQAQTVARLYANDPARVDEEVRNLRDQEIEQLIEEKLILHEFQTGGYATNLVEAFVDDEIRKQIKDKYGEDHTVFINTLKAQGKSYQDYRRDQREWIIVNEIMKPMNKSNLRKILISPLKIEQYYNQHNDEYKVTNQIHLRMIALNQASDSPAGTARRLAEEILAKIDAGVPFAEMAAVNSSGTQRSEGGDRGWVEQGYLAPELDREAFALKAGQHSGVIELPAACYLMMVEEARPAHVRPMSEVRDEIERKLKDEESAVLYKQWIERLKRKSWVRFYQ